MGAGVTGVRWGGVCDPHVVLKESMRGVAYVCGVRGGLMVVVRRGGNVGRRTEATVGNVRI